MPEQHTLPIASLLQRRENGAPKPTELSTVS